MVQAFDWQSRNIVGHHSILPGLPCDLFLFRVHDTTVIVAINQSAGPPSQHALSRPAVTARTPQARRHSTHSAARTPQARRHSTHSAGRHHRTHSAAACSRQAQARGPTPPTRIRRPTEEVRRRGPLACDKGFCSALGLS